VSATCCLFLKHATGDVDASDQHPEPQPAPGSSSPTAAAHERYRVGLHAVADLARSSGRRATISSAARPSCRAPWSLQASSCAGA
jgi:hypothetical protein